jgi:hypothetical protein
VGVALTACGGGSSSPAAHSSSTTAPASTGITKGAYIQQANAICTDMNNQARTAQSTSSDPAVQADSVDDISAITRTALEKLRALPTPAGDAEVLGRAYAHVDTTLHDAGQVAAALRAGDIATARSISKTLAKDARAANDASTAYGLTVCGATT